MPKKPVEYIHILCNNRAYLEPIKVMGPIVQPLKVSKSAAVQLLMSGATVYEVDIVSKKTLKLSLANINDPKRWSPTATIKPVITEPVTPILKPGVPVIQEEKTEDVVPEITPVNEVIDSAEVIVDKENEEMTADNYEFSYLENGLVDETAIPWSNFTKNQKKALRARINEHNATVVASTNN